ncbi:hypothetical protein F4780DRAFT_91241 [Xylariomycetidae sp. FL0641]|nr:hypothetical protein F4780DRAFT_91241 [Xylariomycetidae sp. FL0641]
MLALAGRCTHPPRYIQCSCPHGSCLFLSPCALHSVCFSCFRVFVLRDHCCHCCLFSCGIALFDCFHRSGSYPYAMSGAAQSLNDPKGHQHTYRRHTRKALCNSLSNTMTPLAGHRQLHMERCCGTDEDDHGTSGQTPVLLHWRTSAPLTLEHRRRRLRMALPRFQHIAGLSSPLGC